MRKDLTDLRCLTARHIKLYFKDKQTFFMSLITPLILVVLFATFLRSVYVSSLTSAHRRFPRRSREIERPLVELFFSHDIFHAFGLSGLFGNRICLYRRLRLVFDRGGRASYLRKSRALYHVRSLARGDRGDVFENGGRRRSRRHHRFLHVRVSLRRVYAYFPVCRRYPQFRDVYSRNLRDGIVPPLFHGRSGGGNSKIRAGRSGFRASRRVRFQFVFLGEFRLSRRLCRRARRLGHPARCGVLPDRAFFRETEKARKAQYSALSMTPPPRHSSPRYKTAY